MNDNRPSKPTLSPAGAREAEERRQRQAKALRANLARRKARDRALDSTAAPPGPALEPLESQNVSDRPAAKPGDT